MRLYHKNTEFCVIAESHCMHWLLYQQYVYHFYELGNTRIEYRITVMTSFNCTWHSACSNLHRWRNVTLRMRRQPRDVMTSLSRYFKNYKWYQNSGSVRTRPRPILMFIPSLVAIHSLVSEKIMDKQTNLCQIVWISYLMEPCFYFITSKKVIPQPKKNIHAFPEANLFKIIKSLINMDPSLDGVFRHAKF